MGFIGFSRTFMSQTMLSFTMMTGVMLFVFKSEGTVSTPEVVMLLVTVLLRSLTISVKYGYFQEWEMRDVIKRVLTGKEIASRLILPSWMGTTPESRYAAIQECFERTQILEENYPLSFVEKLTPEEEKRYKFTKMVKTLTQKEFKKITKMQTLPSFSDATPTEVTSLGQRMMKALMKAIRQDI